MTTSSQIALPKPPKRRARKIKGQIHPDTRPCPSWCYVGIEDDREKYDHEIVDNRPDTAKHLLDKILTTRASLYPADTDSTTQVVRTAEFVSHLEQLGSERPQVRVGLRSHPRKRGADGLYRRTMKYNGLMKLTVEDARELAAMLTYLADVADAG